MQRTPVIVIFDVGKTNKKVYVFNEAYDLVFERSARFTETFDEDGEVCENLDSLRQSVWNTLLELISHEEFEIRMVNFSAYGASLVYVDAEGEPIAPLYNYLKAYPEELKNQFYQLYGGEVRLAAETSSPVLGSLNSGLQLYRIKHQKPRLFSRIHYALHLPQYLSFLVCGVPTSGLTSIGCHTHLWNFSQQQYHQWVLDEGLVEKLAPVMPEDQTFPARLQGQRFQVGIGLHDSSAALIPYILNFKEPFILISTGTWCITMNPFYHDPLSSEELEQDCLNYMAYQGKPVMASRIFAGYEHEQQFRRIANWFGVHSGFYRGLHYDERLAGLVLEMIEKENEELSWSKTSAFASRDLAQFQHAEHAYYALILDIIRQQIVSSRLVMKTNQLKRIFVDGGFSKNEIYMNFLARFFPDFEVFAASMAQGSAFGAALAVHQQWNSLPVPGQLIELKFYAGNRVQPSS